MIEPPHAVALPVTDLSAMPQAEREARARQITDSEARQPFDLEAGPLLRAQLLRLAARGARAAAHVHHIVSDGWSMGVLWRELAALYAAFVSGQRRRLPGAADPVRRLRGLAARVAAGRGARSAARLLEGRSSADLSDAGAAHRPAAPAGAAATAGRSSPLICPRR